MYRLIAGSLKAVKEIFFFLLLSVEQKELGKRHPKHKHLFSIKSAAMKWQHYITGEASANGGRRFLPVPRGRRGGC